MGKFATGSTLFRLIEAGQLARQTLLLPLADSGLEAGDDALLFAIRPKKGSSMSRLTRRTGLYGPALEGRLVRLLSRSLVAREPIGKTGAAGIVLTDKGHQLHTLLTDHWAQLESALLDELSAENRQLLRATLKRFISLMRV